MSVTIQVPKAHSDLQNLIMNFFLMPPEVTEMWVANGTKFGKSLSGSGALCSKAPLVKQALFRWVAPLYSQSKIGYKYCARMLPDPPFCEPSEHKKRIMFPSLETQIQFFHGQDPEALEGEAVTDQVFDEAAKLKEAVYASGVTTQTFTRGKRLMISTPRGKNWFYKKWQGAYDRMVWERANGRTPTVLAITAPTSANPFVPRESIIDAERHLPPRLFKQYYLAEFVDDGTVFTGFRELLYGAELQFFPGARERWVHPDAKQMDVVLGGDWAQTKDFTVLTAWCPTTRRLVGFDRFQGLDYRMLVKEVYHFARNFRSIHVLCHDKTGLGTVVDNLMEDLPFPNRGVTFTNESKSFMVNQMIVAMQRGANGGIAGLPNWPTMLSELDSYEVTTNELGRMKYSAPAGMHDDVVSSMFLGWTGALDFASDAMEVQTLEDLASRPPDRSPVENWYAEIAEELDEEEAGIRIY